MIARLFKSALFLVSAFVWAAFFWVGLRRLPCAVENGNLEGLMMDHVARIAHGQPLYVEPSLGFTPFAYMPLYTTIVGLLSRVLGLEFWVGRAVAMGAATGLALLMLWIVRRETGSKLLGFAAGAIWLWGQGLIAGGYDLIRSDPPMLFFAFLGLAVLRYGRGATSAVLAALLGAAAFFTKQHGLVLACSPLPWLLLCDRKRFLPYLLTLAAAAGGGFAVLSAWLGPWFRFYVYDVPSHWSQLDRVRILDFLQLRLLGSFSPLTLPALFAFARGGKLWNEPVSFWWWTGLGGIGCGFLATLDPYQYFHVLMPVLAALAITGPIAIHRLLIAGETTARWRGEAFACCALALQFLAILYHPLAGHVRRDDGREARAAWVARLAAEPGPVLMPYHGWYTTLAGKGPSISLLPIDDILRSHGNSLLERDPQFIAKLFEPLRRGPGRPVLFTDVPLDSFRDRSGPYWRSLRFSYRLADTLPLEPSLRALDGYGSTPRFLYRPIEPDAAADSSGPGSPDAR